MTRVANVARAHVARALLLMTQFVRTFLKSLATSLEDIHKKSFLDEIREVLEKENEHQWLEIVRRKDSKVKKGGNKLRTYSTFKSEFLSECYVYTSMPKLHRSAYAKFRSGTAPIRLETGRYESLKVEDRICPMCHMCVEDEIHVLLECNIYRDIHTQLLKDIVTAHPNVLVYSKREILKCILGCNDEILVKKCSKACHEILSRRRQILYT